MHTPDFKLKPLRTLGIFLACGALIAGCAGNSVKPMSQDTGPISSSTGNNAPLAASEDSASEQTPSATTSPPASKDIASSADNTTPANKTNAKLMQSDAPETDAQAPAQTASVATEPTQSTFYFGVNKSELNDQDKAVLEQHARFLKANPTLVLEINGHTDSTGSHDYNEYLSKRRADAVAKVLINDGVTRSQLVINALADNKPLPDHTDPGRNRRVELQYDDMSMVSSN